MGIDDWSTDESQNLELDGSDISRRASPGAPANELTRKLMAHVKELEEKIVSDGIAVDGVTIENNSGTLTVKDVAIDGDTTDLLTAKIEEIEAAATQAGEDATAAQTAATQAAASAASAATAITSAATAANLAAEQADIATRAAARAQAGATLAESAVQAVVAQTNLNWQKTEKAASVAVYPVPETVLETAVEFALTETDPESGTKGPDNPSAITGVSSITVTLCETTGVNETQYTVDLGGTYFGGSVDVNAGIMTVTHTVVELTSADIPYDGDDIGGGFYRFSTRYFQLLSASGEKTSTHFPFLESFSNKSNHFYVASNGKFAYLFTTYSSASAFGAWLDAQKVAGTPVLLCYPLATAFDVAISSQQIISLQALNKYEARINTIYSDQKNVQVGYTKSPIRTEYELTQVQAP